MSNPRGQRSNLIPTYASRDVVHHAIMKNILPIIVLILIVSCSNLSDREGKKSSNKTEVVQEMIAEPTKVEHSKKSKYWDELLKQELHSSLNELSDTIYIIDRTTLEKIGERECSESEVKFIYTTNEDDKIEIKLKKGKFALEQHDFTISDTVYRSIDGQEKVVGFIAKNIIDGKRSYGIDGIIPKEEIEVISITWNDKNIRIPYSVYSNFYEPNFCEEYLPIEVYLTNDKKIFLYMSGSDGAGAYSVKFIFNSSRY